MTSNADRPPAKLRVEGLCKRYGATTVLEPSSLSVAEGEFLTLLGPSGSGKTTLLQLICGLLAASEGKIVIDGRDQSDMPVHQRDIGLVFQHYALFPHLTVAENVAFPLKMRGRPAAEIAKLDGGTPAKIVWNQGLYSIEGWGHAKGRTALRSRPPVHQVRH